MAPVTRRSALKYLAASAGPLVMASPQPPSKRMYLSLNETLVTGRIKWPEFARLAARRRLRERR